MPLFSLFNRNKNNFRNRNFGPNFNNNHNPFNVPNSFNNFNNLGMDNMPKPYQSHDYGVHIKPLNQEEMRKIQEEMQENIKKINMISKVEDHSHKNFSDYADFSSKLGEFIQDEQNSGVFYASLSKKLENQIQIKEIEKISKDCFEQVENLKKLYFKKNKKDFIVKKQNINTDFVSKDALAMAIDEEIKSYEKICNILEENVEPEIFSYFSKRALHKLKRITSLQFILIQNL